VPVLLFWAGKITFFCQTYFLKNKFKTFIPYVYNLKWSCNWHAWNRRTHVKDFGWRARRKKNTRKTVFSRRYNTVLHKHNSYNIILKQTGWESADWINVAQGREKWWAVEHRDITWGFVNCCAFFCLAQEPLSSKVENFCMELIIIYA
jgi:hypothetical protein